MQCPDRKNRSLIADESGGARAVAASAGAAVGHVERVRRSSEGQAAGVLPHAHRERASHAARSRDRHGVYSYCVLCTNAYEY